MTQLIDMIYWGRMVTKPNLTESAILAEAGHLSYPPPLHTVIGDNSSLIYFTKYEDWLLQVWQCLSDELSKFFQRRQAEWDNIKFFYSAVVLK